MSRDRRHRRHHGDPHTSGDASHAPGKRAHTDRMRGHHRGGAADGDRAGVPARQLLAEITDRQPAAGGMLVTCNVGNNDGVTDDTVFTLAYASGGTMPDGDLAVVSRRGEATTLRSASWDPSILSDGALVLVLIPAHREPPPAELHADGSIGDTDGDTRLED